MQTKREQAVIHQIVQRYGKVIDLEKSPGVLIEILREFAPHVFTDDGTGGAPSAPPPTPPSSIAIAGPGSPRVTMEDLMRIILDVRQQVIKLHERGTAAH